MYFLKDVRPKFQASWNVDSKGFSWSQWSVQYRHMMVNVMLKAKVTIITGWIHYRFLFFTF